MKALTWPLLARTFVSGSVASLATTVVLAALARRRGSDAVQPLNSTSHWYLGEAAGRSRRIDLRHTLLGYATHHAASLFWAAVFEVARQVRPRRAPLTDAVAVSALAAFVDYVLVPGGSRRDGKRWSRRAPSRSPTWPWRQASPSVARCVNAAPRDRRRPGARTTGRRGRVRSCPPARSTGTGSSGAPAPAGCWRRAWTSAPSRCWRRSCS